MNRQGRSQLALGVILILLGAWFLLDKTNSQFATTLRNFTAWPLNMFLIGAAILVIGLATGSPGMAVPAVIVAGIGGIFYYQQVTHSYDSWSYMWTLIPGFVGIGAILRALLGESPSYNFSHGLKLVVISAVLFLVFGSFLGGFTPLGSYAPAVLLILLGAWILGSGVYRSFRNKGE